MANPPIYPMRDDALDQLAEVMYNAWREPPSLTWDQIIGALESRRVTAGDGDQTPFFLLRWRRAAKVVLTPKGRV